MRGHWRPLVCFVVALIAALPPQGASLAADEAPARDLAAALQKRYERVRDFSADFVHEYQGGALRLTLSERGRVLVKKPGKMRWEYTAPEEKLFVSDGTTMYSYIPGDKQVIVAAVPQGEEAATPTLFLSGKGDVVRDFTPSMADPRPAAAAGTRALKLVPRTPQRDYDWLILELDPASLAIRGLITTDAQGGRSSFTFSNMKENLALADTLFEFKIPRGADVVSDASRLR